MALANGDKTDTCSLSLSTTNALFDVLLVIWTWRFPKLVCTSVSRIRTLSFMAVSANCIYAILALLSVGVQVWFRAWEDVQIEMNTRIVNTYTTVRMQRF